MLKSIKKSIHILYCIYAMTVFLFWMIILFPFIVLASLLKKPHDGNVIFYFLRFWAAVWFPMVGIIQKRIYQESKIIKGPVVYVANHGCFLDAALLVNALRGNYRPLGKADLGRIPIFGFIYKSAVVLVDRSSHAHRTRSVRHLNFLLRQGISVAIFPEGTFNETPGVMKGFYDGAFKIALENQVAIQPLVFLDHTKRMHPSGIFTLNPGISRVVFLKRIYPDGYHSQNLSLLKNLVHQEMGNAILQYQT
ncbi:MAG: lysophospholipid acyltransferase family protein [Chitinophagaceae bacterium]